MTTLREWLTEKYITEFGTKDKDANQLAYNSIDEAVELNLIESYKGQSKKDQKRIKENYKRQCRTIRCYLIDNNISTIDDDANIDVTKHNVSLLKSKQRLQDLNRVTNKELRESFRAVNSLEELNKNLIELLSKQSFKPKKSDKIKNISNSSIENVEVVHVTDWHIGEEIDLKNNKYNYEEAGKRLKLLANEVISRANYKNASYIVVMFGGDNINNDILLEKMLNNADNRTKVMFIASYLFSQFLQDLSNNYDVHVVSVNGNETRVLPTKNIPTDKYLLSHNYDYCIFNILKVLFKDIDSVVFHDTDLDETVIEILGHNILLTHGHTFNSNSLSDIDKIIRKYAKKGIILSNIFCGHLHGTLINNTLCRSGSGCGTNSYSESRNYSSFASQNLANITRAGVTPTAFSLQDTSSIDNGYDFPRDIEEYNNMFVNKDNSEKANVLKIL